MTLSIDDKLDIIIHALADLHTRLAMLEEALYEPELDDEESGGSEEPPLMH